MATSTVTDFDIVRNRVLFEFTPEHESRIYEQPLYYLAENYRQSLLSPELAEQQKIDTNLSFDTSLNLQISGYSNDKQKNQLTFRYILNKIDATIVQFTYKNCTFSLNTLAAPENPISTDCLRASHTRLAYYEIVYSKRDMAVFEEFLKTAVNYHTKFIDESTEDTKKINIYVNHEEGYYFDFITSRVKRPLDTIYLPAEKKKDIVDDLTRFLDPVTQERYVKLGLHRKRVYLLYGVPGSGKTSFIVALASHFDYDVGIVSFGPKFKDTDMIHLLKHLNTNEKTSRKKFLILEDIDCIFKERKSNDEGRNMVSFSGLLNIFDGLGTPDNLICFITTNYKDRLDSALIRPGRVDYTMNFEYVAKEQIVDIFDVYMDLNTKNNELSMEFYNAVKTLRLRLTFSLLQQYLLKYLDNPRGAIDNIAEMKKMYEVSTTDKFEFGEDSGLFS